jgi:hypothetical protein
MHDVEVTLRWGPIGTHALGALGLGREIASEISRRKGGLIIGDAPWIRPTPAAFSSIHSAPSCIEVEALPRGEVGRWVSGCLYVTEKED